MVPRLRPSSAPRAPASQLGVPRPWSAGTQHDGVVAGLAQQRVELRAGRERADAGEPVDRRARGGDEALERVARRPLAAPRASRRGRRPGGAGGASPACASTNAPVPSVTFAAPGSQQRSPNSDACWSPSGGAHAARRRSSRSIASESTIGGSSARGMPNRSSSSSSQSVPPSGHSSERRGVAGVAHVRRRRGGAAATRRRRRRRGRLARRLRSSTQRSFVAGNVASSSSPVRSRTSAACSRSAAHASSVRRSCHTIAGWTARAGRAVPDHERLGLVGDPERGDVARRGARRGQRAGDRRSRRRRDRLRVLLDQPGRRERARDRHRRRRRARAARSSSATQRVLDVPWSSPRTSSVTRGAGGRARPSTGAVRGQRALVVALGLGGAAGGDPRVPGLDLGARALGGSSPSAPAISAAAGAPPRAPRSGAVSASRVRRSSTSSRCERALVRARVDDLGAQVPPPPSSGSPSSGRAAISAASSAARRAAARRASPTARVDPERAARPRRSGRPPSRGRSCTCRPRSSSGPARATRRRACG